MRRMLALLFVIAAVSPVLSPALAEDRPAAAPGKVAITLLVVHATDAQTGVDPRLQSLATSFRYFKYAGYRLLATHTADVASGADASFTIEGGRKVTVTLLSRDDARARVRVEMSNAEGKQLDTTVSINRDGTFIVAGPKYKDGILMLPLQAGY